MSRAGTDEGFAGSIPQIYDRLLVPLIFEPYAADLVARIAPRPLATVLEIAAGTGVVTRHLARSLPDCVAIVATDLAPAMLETAAATGTARAVEWRQVAGTAIAREPIDGGIRLALTGIDPRKLVDLVVREQECCAFLSFAIRLDPAGTTLEVTGPAAAREVIESLADPVAQGADSRVDPAHRIIGGNEDRRDQQQHHHRED